MIESDFPQLFSWLSLCSCLCISLISLTLGRVRGGQAMGLLNLSLVLWQGGKIAGNYFGPGTWQGELSVWISIAGVTWMPTCFLWLGYQVGQKRMMGKGLFFAMLFSSAFCIAQSQKWVVWDWVNSPWGYYHRPAKLYLCYMIYYAIVFVMALHRLLPRLWWTREGFKRQQWAIGIAAIIGVALGSLEFANTLWGPHFPIANLSPLVFSFGLSWALYRFDLYDGIGIWRRIILYLGVVICICLCLWTANLIWVWLCPQSLSVPLLGIAMVIPIAVVAWNRLMTFMDPIGHATPSEWQYFQTWMATQDRLRPFMDGMVSMAQERGYQDVGAFCYSAEERNTLWFGTKPKRWNQSRAPQMGAAYIKLLHRRSLMQALRFRNLDEQEKSWTQGAVRFLNHWGTEVWLPLVNQGELLGALWMREPRRVLASFVNESRALETVAQTVAGRVALLNILIEKGREERLAEIGFLTASLAHQIRNPLEAMLGASEVLIETQDPEMAQIIHKEALRLDERLSLFLNWIKEVQIHPLEIDLGVFCRRMLPEQVSIEASSICAWADQHCLEQIIEVWWQNAQRYGQAPYSIDFDLDATAATIHFRDCGPGAKHPEKLFQAFQTSSAQGHGLGLALADKLARAMHAELTYISQEKGAHFQLRLALPESKKLENP